MIISKNVAKWGSFYQILIIFVFSASLAANPEDELKQLLDQIDTSLVTQAQSDFAEWHQYVSQDIHGVLRSPRREGLLQSHPFAYKALLEEGDIKLDMKHGCATNEAAILFRLYEILGNPQFLTTGLKYCDFLVDAQLERGHWARTYIVNPDEPGSCYRLVPTIWIG